MTRQPLTVAVVGATGVVGRTMIQVLNEREFPVGELRLLASGRSAGRTVSIDGQSHEIQEALPDAFEGVDIALFSAGADISLQLAPAAAARGATVIDNSSAWRMDPNVPLVVSQVNPDDLEGHAGIIANPNCSTMELVPVLMALRDTVGIERVIVDTYQAVSGTGADAIAEFEGQIRAHVAGEEKHASVYPHPIAFNALPQVDVFLDNGYTKEEWKLVTESRKILHLPDLRISSHGRSGSRCSSPTRRRCTSRRVTRSRRIARGPCSGPFQASSSRTTRRRRPTRSRWRRRAATKSSSGGSGTDPRSTVAAESRSGSSATTSARARRRMPSSSRSSLVERGWVRSAAAAG